MPHQNFVITFENLYLKYCVCFSIVYWNDGEYEECKVLKEITLSLSHMFHAHVQGMLSHEHVWQLKLQNCSFKIDGAYVTLFRKKKGGSRQAIHIQVCDRLIVDLYS